MPVLRSFFGVFVLRLFLPVVALLAGAGTAAAQTTQGLISGRIVDSVTGVPLRGAAVSWTNQNTNGNGSAVTGAAGFYVLPLLSPGNYRIRIAADNYQAQEVQELELPVAARLDLSFRMRPLSDVWEAGQYRSVFLPGSEAILTFYGPDIDTSRTGSFVATRGRQGALEATLSQVIDPCRCANCRSAVATSTPCSSRSLASRQTRALRAASDFPRTAKGPRHRISCSTGSRIITRR